MNIKKHGVLPGRDYQTMPCISVVLPFESKMKKREVLFNLLASIADTEEKQLLNHYPEQAVSEVVNKFRKMIKTIDCPRNGKTIGIFISPVAEKVYYFSPSHLDSCRLPPLA